MLKVKNIQEEALLERIKSNDRSVLGELFIRYEKMVFSYIKSHGGANADAEDMLQEAIIVLWQKVNGGNFVLTAKLSTFVMSVAKNKWMSEMRKRKRYSNEDVPDSAADDQPSSLDNLISNERHELLQRAMNNISATCKKLLLLYYFEERNMSDIAEQLGFAGPDVAKAKKYQCKKSLEALMKESLAKTEGRM